MLGLCLQMRTYIITELESNFRVPYLRFTYAIMHEYLWYAIKGPSVTQW